ncbi:phage major capsid protein [uncultured Reyranella sp.]|uniref:phage major capsid protein n=1 Tax=uncultured Reyranella sp. TaxID=735512 RepID=UPI00259CF11B|nr:phage major capsid protein [uncultured Reyranella sp.]
MRKALLLGSTMLALPLAVFAMAGDTDERLQALRDEVRDLEEQRDAIVTAADEAGADLTDEQVEEIEALQGKIDAKAKQVTIRENLVASRTGAGRKSAPAPTVDANGNRVVGTPAKRNLGAKGGFTSLGEFAVAVMKGSGPGAEMDQRLRAAATTFGNEGTGADGGFAVPAEFRADIWKKVTGEDSLMSRCTPLQTGSNSMTIPKDETTPWQTSGGVQAYWEGEGVTIPASKPALEMSTIRLAKLTALVPMSDELLEDAPGIESWLKAKAPEKMQAKINTAIIDGTGVGMPLGVLRSASAIKVSKESGQSADTILFKNISNMWSRMYGPCRRNAVWLINQDIEPQLDTMAFDPAATDKFPVYLPAGGLSASPYATLKGRPVIPVEACKTLGDAGDIILVDLSQYMALTKTGGIKSDASIHLYFDQNLTTFRFIFRMAGQPWWGSTISPQNGTMTRSWATYLEDR